MELIFKLDDIANAAQQFLVATTGHKVFALHGDMGAGKTTFIHTLCEAMGVKDAITSPTFPSSMNIRPQAVKRFTILISTA